ncbi:hypothetical protein [Kribbella sp. CA-294648]|uniref:hypothetical protein n=1 Tax=Kribbella sp. CA-294648 TaxID=3239948 RepID=UPI003D8C85BE
MPDDVITPETATSAFCQWAEAAALPTDPALAAQALAPEAKDPERLFLVLLQATGITTPGQS